MDRNRNGSQRWPVYKKLAARLIIGPSRWRRAFRLEIVDEIDDWYSELAEEGSGNDWFSLSLGVIVAGEKVNLCYLY